MGGVDTLDCYCVTVTQLCQSSVLTFSNTGVETGDDVTSQTETTGGEAFKRTVMDLLLKGF